MTTFYLVRHGKKERLAGDVPLTPAGQREAQLTAHYFASLTAGPLNFSQLLCSPLQRCIETAQPIADALSLPPITDRRLRERANWGDAPGQSFTEFVAEWERCSSERNYTPPGGQSAFRAGRNFAAALCDATVQHPDAHIVVVTHGGVITDFLRNQYSAAALETYNAHYLHMAECSITTVTFDGLQFALQTLAADGHLAV